MALNSVPETASANSQAGRINQQDFLKILLTQLNAQNPLKPMDNSAFVAQLAQFSQLEQTQEMVTSTKQLLAVQTSTQSIALLGRTVSILNGTSVATGQVVDVATSGTEPLLTIHPSSGQNITGVALKQIFDIK